ncbi:MAG: UPF0175 family protein [Chloroflexi bacterium]|nr:UPF0175 family protein [Chloroflexota bacterium]
MSTVILEIPAEFAECLGATEEEVRKQARLELAISLYREGKLAPGRAAELAGLSRYEFDDVLMARKVPIPYTKEMVEEDFGYARSRL